MRALVLLTLLVLFTPQAAAAPNFATGSSACQAAIPMAGTAPSPVGVCAIQVSATIHLDASTCDATSCSYTTEAVVSYASQVPGFLVTYAGVHNPQHDTPLDCTASGQSVGTAISCSGATGPQTIALSPGACVPLDLRAYGWTQASTGLPVGASIVGAWVVQTLEACRDAQGVPSVSAA
ncbi:MAG: hypothetical protein QOE90_2544 [Thermoplasmata archaeon]|jgi:hypothetical protein|nr:hypothetical protein [Thermoplasmata archaeon]